MRQVPDTWTEFLVAAARKVNSQRVTSVETLDNGTVLEELDEIMHGDKLVIRCPAPANGPMAPPPGRYMIALLPHDPDSK